LSNAAVPLVLPWHPAGGDFFELASTFGLDFDGNECGAVAVLRRFINAGGDVR